MDYASNPTAGAALLEEVTCAHEAKLGRIPGVHVTDLVMCRRKAWYRLHNYQPAEREAETNLQMLLGIALGALLEEQRHSEVPVVLPLWVDGVEVEVYGTIDILEVGSAGRPVRVIEIKESRSSSAKPLFQQGYYLEQVASYCLASGTPEGRLHVAHLLGDYKAAKQPVMNTWDMTFSDEELQAWADELTDRLRQVMADTPPSTIYTHWSFECKGCAYAHLCPGGQGYELGFFVPRGEEMVTWP